MHLFNHKWQKSTLDERRVYEERGIFLYLGWRGYPESFPGSREDSQGHRSIASVDRARADCCQELPCKAPHSWWAPSLTGK